jgi:hypothetical protein
MPEPEIRKILGTNAVATYGFDPDLLTPIGDRVGPKLEDVVVA